MFEISFENMSRYGDKHKYTPDYTVLTVNLIGQTDFVEYYLSDKRTYIDVSCDEALVEARARRRGTAYKPGEARN